MVEIQPDEAIFRLIFAVFRDFPIDGLVFY